MKTRKKFFTSNEELADFAASLELSFRIDVVDVEPSSEDGDSLFKSAARFTFSLAIFDHESSR